MSQFREITLGIAALVLTALGFAAACEGSWPGFIAGCGAALAILCLLVAKEPGE